MDAATRDETERTATRLGYPWEQLWEARFATLEAARAAELALEAGEERDRKLAAFDLEAAIAAEKARRGDVADALVVMLTAAIEERPFAVYGLAMAFAGSVHMDGLKAWMTTTKAGGMAHVADLEQRLQAAEAELKKARAERWELANWIARLEREKNSHTTGGPEHGDRRPREGQTVVAPDTGGRDDREAG